MGTGNILAGKPKKTEAGNKVNDTMNETAMTSELGMNNFEKMRKRETLPIRYSPIVELYLKTNKYKTRNYVSEFKMKYTQVDKKDQLK